MNLTTTFSRLSSSICKALSSLQAELFDKFLHGSTLEECYSAVASVANRWLDLLDVCKQSDLLVLPSHTGVFKVQLWVASHSDLFLCYL